MLILAHYLVGWPVALILLAALVSVTRRAVRGPAGNAGTWITPLLFGCALISALTGLGMLPLVMGVVLAVLTLAAAVVLLRAWTPQGRAVARGHAKAGLGWLREDARAGRARLSRKAARGKGRGGFNWGAQQAQQAGNPQAAAAEAAASRSIPSVMADPHLGSPPEPADLASASVPVPAPWAALAQYIREREPADDHELRMFQEGDMAGALAVADARHAFADTCLNSIRLSPAYVAGELEAGDSMAEHSSLLSQVYKRYLVIYGHLKEWVGANGPLPKDGDFVNPL